MKVLNSKTLKDVLPYDAQFEFEGRDKRLATLLNVGVLAQFDPRKPGEHWEGSPHRNIIVWFLLEDGHAVGFNENISVGWAFPVIRLPIEEFKSIKAKIEAKKDKEASVHAVISLHDGYVSYRIGNYSGSNPCPNRNESGALAKVLTTIMNVCLAHGAKTFEFLEG